MSGKITMPQNLRDIWTDVYKFHAEFETMSNTIEGWKRCIEKAEDLDQRLNHPLAKHLIIAVIEYLEDARRFKREAV